MAKHQVEYANVVIRAGDRELLDIFEESVWPVFKDRKLRRFYGGSTFFFSASRGLVEDWKGTQQALVAARLVRTTTLKREQYYDAKLGLVPDEQALESAPSGVLVLILNSHKLVYFHETAFAPSLAQVETVLDRFIGTKHEERVRATYRRREADGVPTTLRAVRQEFPRPTVEVIPLSSEGTLFDFIDSMDVLKSIEVRLVRPNSELDLNPFFKTARAEQERLNSVQTSITQRNSAGLAAEEAKPYVAAATKQGNARVKLSGLDENGDKIAGDNNSFSIKTVLERAPKQLAPVARRLFAEFDKLAKAGRITLTAGAREAHDRAVKVAVRLGWIDRESGRGESDDPED